MGKFLQSSWDSMRDNTSLKDGLVALRENEERRNFNIQPPQVKNNKEKVVWKTVIIADITNNF